MRKIIPRSDSPYASRIVLVRKKNGETSPCVDHRELNKIMLKYNFLGQLIDNKIDQLKVKKIFRTFHFNIFTAKLTSFVAPMGQFEFLYCPFGLTFSPKVFHLFVRQIFSELIGSHKLLTMTFLLLLVI